MSILSSIGSGILAPIKMTGRAAMAAKPITGGIIGGAYGALSTDEYSSNQVFRNALIGAAAGAGIGAATTKFGIGVMKEMGQGIGSLGKRAIMSSPKAIAPSHIRSGATLFGADLTMKESISYYGNRLAQGGIARLGRKAGRVGAGIGNFAMNHPYMATGIAAGTYGVASNIGAGMNSSGYTQENAEAMSIQAGTSSPSRQMLMNSTNGLVQGMHRGRHSGG